MSRLCALNMLCEVVDGNAYLNLSAKKHLEHLSQQDKNFAYSLCALTVENLTSIDNVLKPYISSAKRVNGKVKNVLRLSVCQMFLMNVPLHTAVNEGTKLCKACGKGALSGFVNGVLRNITRDYNQLSIVKTHPDWLKQLLIAQWGESLTNEFLNYEYDNSITEIRVNTLKSSVEALSAHFQVEDVQGDILAVRNIVDVANDSFYKKGDYTPMGLASAIAVKSVYDGELSVLDLCCAPGGKSAYVAALSQNRAEIIANDLHPHRIELTRKNFERLGVRASVHVSDAATLSEQYLDKFDLVIVDAPCSALGLYHKKPDLRNTPPNLETLNVLQKNILKNAAQYVKTGGKLAYFTCSVLKCENEDVVEGVMKENSDFKYIFENKTLLPCRDQTDGFFISCLRRR